MVQTIDGRRSPIWRIKNKLLNISLQNFQIVVIKKPIFNMDYFILL